MSSKAWAVPIIKFAIPVVGVPLTTGLNYWTTRLAGYQAKALLQREARIIESASSLVERTTHHEGLLLTIWMLISTSSLVSTDQRLLMHHATVAAQQAGCPTEILEKVKNTIDLDAAAY